MFTFGKPFMGCVAAMALAAMLSGCGGVDVDINAPLLEGAGLNVKEALMGKPAPEPNLPERAPLVLPPPRQPQSRPIQ